MPWVITKLISANLLLFSLLVMNRAGRAYWLEWMAYMCEHTHIHTASIAQHTQCFIAVELVIVIVCSFGILADKIGYSCQ